jgi:signal transduction histidine kinase
MIENGKTLNKQNEALETKAEASTILIIDDSKVSRNFFKKVLEKMGFQTLLSSNGKEGAAIAIKEKPAAVMVDLLMPDMSGYEVMKELRANPITKFISLIAITSLSKQDAYEEAMAAGANGFISKKGEAEFLQVSLHDILSSGKAFESLFEANQKIMAQRSRLKWFTSRLMTTGESEKKELSRNLHDEAGTISISMGSKLNLLENALDKGDVENAKEVLVDVKKCLKKFSGNLKNMALELRPQNLDTVGLEGALKLLIANYMGLDRPEIHLSINVDDSQLGDLTSITIYRVTQEALNNIVKYANAKEVHITINSEMDSINYCIVDNGDGFDINGSSLNYGIGIDGMRGRVISLDGTFEIDSVIGRGTKVCCKIKQDIQSKELV